MFLLYTFDSCNNISVAAVLLRAVQDTMCNASCSVPAHAFQGSWIAPVLLLTLQMMFDSMCCSCVARRRYWVANGPSACHVHVVGQHSC